MSDPGMDDTSKSVYAEDCEFVRYHDGLMWNRFQTVAAIEAAMLYARYEVNHLTIVERALLSIVGTVLVFLGCLLTFTDRVATKSHLERLKRIEEEAALTNTVLAFKYKKPSSLAAPAFLWAVLLLLTISNLFIILKLFCPF